MEQKALSKKQDTSISTTSLWGEAPSLSAQDFQMSKILPMQGLSDKVMDRKAAFGELRDSVTNECYGGIGTPMEFIPFHMQKVWIEEDFDPSTKKYKYARTVPITPNIDNLPYESDGIRRTRQYNFFVLLPSEIKGGNALPKLLSFKSTSIQAGKILNTQMYRLNPAAKLSQFAFTMNLSVKSEKNDKGTYAVLSVEKLRRTGTEEEHLARYWHDILLAGNVKVDETSAEVEEKPAITKDENGPIFDNRSGAEKLANPGAF